MKLLSVSRLLACLAGLVSSATVLAQTGTALVRRAPTLNGSVEGSVRLLTPESVTLNGGAAVSGDLLLPGTPGVRLNGKPVYAGTLDGTGAAAPANHQVTLNGGATLRHVVRRTDAVPLAAVAAPPAPAGTRSVVLNGTGQSAGDFATLRNLTLNGNAGAVAVPPGVYGAFTANSGGFTLGVPGAAVPAHYAFQSLTLNGNAALAVVGPVVVTLAGGFEANGGPLGAAGRPDWLGLRFAAGGLTLNGNVSVYGYIEAPAGTLTLNGSARLVGGVAADRLTVNGGALLRLVAPPVANVPPTVALTEPAAGAVFTAPAVLLLRAAAGDTDGTVARVEFFRDGAKLGEDAAAPYEWAVAALAAGEYAFSAWATDNGGATAESAPVTVTVRAANRPPTVSLVAPADGAVFPAGSAILLTATAADADQAVARVEFFSGAAKLGEKSAQPYDWLVEGAAPGSFIFRVRATDTLGAATDSAPVGVRVNTPPTVALTAPANGAIYPAPAAFTLAATATDADGTVARVDFYRGATKLGETFAAPYVWPVAGLAAGTYAFSARAFDGDGAATVSGAASVTVASPNQPPIVSLATPADGTLFTAPASILLAATASDPDGAVARVEFFQGATKLGERAAAPFEFLWQNVPPGAYELTARAHDQAGASGTSAVRRIAVQVGLPYFTGFEAADGYGVGPLAGQVGWTTTGVATVNQGTAYRGTRTLAVGGGGGAGEAAHTFPGYAGQTVGFIDGFVQPVASTATAPVAVLRTEAARVALVAAAGGATGELYVFQGNLAGGGVWQATGSMVPLGADGRTAAWVRLTVREDYEMKRWDLYAEGRMVAGDLTFSTHAVTRPASIAFAGPAGGAASAFDDVFVGFENPLFTDGDKDGLDDAWETANGLNPAVNDRDSDADGDGVTAAAEYRKGTNPRDFFDAVVPRIEALNGGTPGPFDELALIVRRPNGSPWPNAPAVFAITSGGRKIGPTTSGPFSTSVEVRADSDGIASAFLEPLP